MTIWEASVRALPPAGALDPTALRDHVPQLLDGIAELLEARDDTDVIEIAKRHAIHRLDEGFETATLVRELGMLREAILKVAHLEDGCTGNDVRALAVAFDLTIATSVDRHVRAREQRLRDSLERALAGPRFLAGVTHALSQSLDYQETLERLVGAVVPQLADSCEVDLANRTSEAEIVTDAARSVMVVPIVGRSEVLGAISLTSTSRDYQISDLAIASELGIRAGFAIENMRLYRQSQDAVTVRDNILAIVSHDLRNPLGAIELGASSLQTQPADERTQRTLATIRRSVKRMEHLIGDLLDMARIKSGTFSIDPLPDDAGKIVAELVEFHTPAAADRGIAIDVRTELDGIAVCWDRDRIAQALGNVLGNAVKFCRKGDTVTLRGRPREGKVELEIIDTGPGIAPEHIGRLFDPYWSTRRDNRQGTGLGLHICRAIIEAHRGTVTATSELGRGSTFAFVIPTEV